MHVLQAMGWPGWGEVWSEDGIKGGGPYAVLGVDNLTINVLALWEGVHYSKLEVVMILLGDIRSCLSQ